MNPGESRKERRGFGSLRVVVGVGGRWWKKSSPSDVRVDGVIGGGDDPGEGSCIVLD